MKKSVLRIVLPRLLSIGIFALFTELAFSHGDFNLPRLSAPEEYGDV